MSIYFQKTFQRSFGTYPLTGDVALRTIAMAAEIGYRAFDTAQMYGNEREVGEALAATGIQREDLCITTKVHPNNFAEERFIASVEQSLSALRVDFLDVLLLHWPPIGGNIEPSLKLLDRARAMGLARNIGVSNYTVAMLSRAAKIVDAPLVTNQVEFHPLLNQETLLAGAAKTGIPLSAYASVARGEVLQRPEILSLGESYGKTAGQIVLRWILQKGVSVNTMSTRPGNMRANFDIMDFTLSHVDMARIDTLSRVGRRIVSKDRAPWAPQWD